RRDCQKRQISMRLKVFLFGILFLADFVNPQNFVQAQEDPKELANGKYERLSIPGFYFEVTPPEGFTLCYAPDGTMYRTPAFLIPLDRSIACDDIPSPFLEDIEFHIQRVIPGYAKPWDAIQKNCVKDEGTVTVDFSEIEYAVGEFPARR